MAKSITIQQFLEMYPDDDACLAHLFETRYGKEPVCPKCGQVDTFHRLKKLPAYTCNCGHHVHPMAGTPFARSRTPLRTWFYVMFLLGLRAMDLRCGSPGHRNRPSVLEKHTPSKACRAVRANGYDRPGQGRRFQGRRFQGHRFQGHRLRA